MQLWRCRDGESKTISSAVLEGILDQASLQPQCLASAIGQATISQFNQPLCGSAVGWIFKVECNLGRYFQALQEKQ